MCTVPNKRVPTVSNKKTIEKDDDDTVPEEVGFPFCDLVFIIFPNIIITDNRNYKGMKNISGIFLLNGVKKLILDRNTQDTSSFKYGK